MACRLPEQMTHCRVTSTVRKVSNMMFQACGHTWCKQICGSHEHKGLLLECLRDRFIWILFNKRFEILRALCSLLVVRTDLWSIQKTRSVTPRIASACRVRKNPTSSAWSCLPLACIASVEGGAGIERRMHSLTSPIRLPFLSMKGRSYTCKRAMHLRNLQGSGHQSDIHLLKQAGAYQNWLAVCVLQGAHEALSSRCFSGMNSAFWKTLKLMLLWFPDCCR